MVNQFQELPTDWSMEQLTYNSIPIGESNYSSRTYQFCSFKLDAVLGVGIMFAGKVLIPADKWDSLSAEHRRIMLCSMIPEALGVTTYSPEGNQFVELLRYLSGHLERNILFGSIPNMSPPNGLSAWVCVS